MKTKWLYVWFIPALWVVFSIGSFFYCGDEHGCFAIGVIAGGWICLLQQFDTLSSALFPVLLAGGIVLAILGFIMDLLNVRKKIWLILFVTCTLIVFIAFIQPLGSIEQIRWKHGSVFAPLFSALNWGIYLAIVFSLITTIITRIFKR